MAVPNVTHGPWSAFELAPVLDRTQLALSVQIESVELCGQWLFLGTTDGRILQFLFQETHPGSSDPTGEPHRVQLVGEKRVSQTEQPVSFIRCVSALNRVLVLCDSQFIILSMSDDLAHLNMSGSGKLKGVHAASINENPTLDDAFSVQICLAKKKQVIVITLTEDKLLVDKIRELPDVIANVVMDGKFVCAALQSHYVICNVESGQIQDLFPFEGVPALTRVAKEEFLLSAPGDLGMFVTSAGVSERPPLPWAKPVVSLVFKAPYIVSMCSDCVVAYSILDQQQKQSLHFTGGRVLGHFDGKLLLASASALYAILPIPAEVQIQNLIEAGLVEKALELAENCQHRGRASKQQFQEVVNNVRQRAGFISLRKWELGQAKELFIRGKLDPQELIQLFPGCLPKSTNFCPKDPPLHDLADISALTQGDQGKNEELHTFLGDFLEYLRAAEGENFPFKKAVDTAIIKLAAPSQPRKVVDHISIADFEGDYEDLKVVLEEHGRHQALALLHELHKNWEAALNIWASLLQNQLEDDTFAGLDLFLTKLIRAPDHLLWRFGDLVMEMDPEKGIKVFFEKVKTEDFTLQEKSLNFLEKYPPAHLRLLEHLVLQMGCQVEKFHTLLATTYLERLTNSKFLDQQSLIRGKFQHFIVRSNLVNPNHLLDRLEHSDLHQEKAILFGKLGDHEKALKIMVHKLEDPEAGENYCDQIAPQKDSKLRKKLLHTLIKVHLDPSLSTESRLKLEPPLVSLLNRRSHEINPVEILPLVPPNWSLATILPALTGMLCALGHEKRMKQVEANLSISHSVNTKLEYHLATRNPIRMAESSYCMASSKQFREPAFVRYPNGIIVHPDLGQDLSVCPITGQVFQASKGDANSRYSADNA